MKTKAALLFFVLWSLVLAVPAARAQDIPEAPNPPRLVNDYTWTLTADQVQSLESRLVAFDDSTSTQIVVVLVPSLAGYDPSDFAIRLAEKWGVGQKGKNNGIVVLVKPKTATERGEAFIASGYGLEAVIPDAICKRIADQEMIPRFQEGDYYGGLEAGTNVLMGLARGEFTADQYRKRTEPEPYGYLVPVLVFIIIFFLIRLTRARSYSVGKSLPFWTAFWLMGSMGRGHSGNWNRFTSGSGGFGSGFGGGGGFGGFGGGSFGGGGAGGSW
jgi:uncharacterized protein